MLGRCELAEANVTKLLAVTNSCNLLKSRSAKLAGMYMLITKLVHRVVDGPSHWIAVGVT
jgi:hypothetical protein